jgi:hypothetical protein
MIQAGVGIAVLSTSARGEHSRIHQDIILRQKTLYCDETAVSHGNPIHVFSFYKPCSWNTRIS